MIQLECRKKGVQSYQEHISRRLGREVSVLRTLHILYEPRYPDIHLLDLILESLSSPKRTLSDFELIHQLLRIVAEQWEPVVPAAMSGHHQHDPANEADQPNDPADAKEHIGDVSHPTPREKLLFIYQTYYHCKFTEGSQNAHCLIQKDHNVWTIYFVARYG